MMLSTLDLIALTIALGSALALIVTSAIANARLTRSRNEWRSAYLTSSAKWAKRIECACECEC